MKRYDLSSVETSSSPVHGGGVGAADGGGKRRWVTFPPSGASRHLPRTRGRMGLVLLLPLLLAACGLRGDLERPPPIMGPDRAAWEKAEAERKAEEAKKQDAQKAAAERPTPIAPQ
jgi:predicted small lipoprotein YifL